MIQIKLKKKSIHVALCCSQQFENTTQTCDTCERKNNQRCGSRLCSLIRAASVLVAVIDLRITKWVTYFCSLSRCTCLLVFLHQPLISHKGRERLWGSSSQNKPCRCTYTHVYTAPHTKECRNRVYISDIYLNHFLYSV